MTASTHARRPSGRQTRIAAICFSLTFMSSFGQTFFIALFGDEIRAKFGLSDGGFGLLYSCATLASGILMIWAGSVVDRVSFRHYSVAAAIILATAAFLFARADSLALMGLAIFGLRLGGQGMMSHAAQIGAARAFDRSRGRALGLTNLGHPAGEAIFPPAAVAALSVLAWPSLWTVAAALALLLALFYSRVVPTGLRSAQAGPAARAAGFDDDTASEGRDWTRAQVLRDRRFHLLLPALMGPGFVSTGIFFHQLPLIAEKGWSLGLYASAFTAFALGVSVAMIGSGALVDRWGAQRMMRGYLLSWATACLLIALIDAPWSAFTFMALAGISQGAAATTVTAMWAETYGLTYLGGIRAMATAVMVLSTALAPGLLGVLLDAGIGFMAIGLGCAVYLVCASLAAAAAFPARRRQRTS